MFPTPAPRCNMEGRCFQRFDCNFWNFWNWQQSNWTIIGFDLLSVCPGGTLAQLESLRQQTPQNSNCQCFHTNLTSSLCFFSRFRNIECFLWSFHLTEENIFNAKNSKARHQKQQSLLSKAGHHPNFLKRIFPRYNKNNKLTKIKQQSLLSKARHLQKPLQFILD